MNLKLNYKRPERAGLPDVDIPRRTLVIGTIGASAASLLVLVVL